MKYLSQILTELSNHGSWEGYTLLYYAIAEAKKTQPRSPSMDQLCKTLVGIGGKQKPETIYRSMARAVDDIWSRPESRPLLKKYYRREMVEKPTPDSFISALARYLWEESPEHHGDPNSPYQVTFGFDCQQYGIVIHMERSQIWASFPAITPDPVRIMQIVDFLREKNVSLEAFKDFYLSGGLHGDPSELRNHG